ncbi:unnamed protein product [Hermetia illucens]|uniref:Uncharacterized protein n=1 Tax=Hermetia illucens TaxID=343691 RepID=A0A7R8UYE7_HERIL|nr:unnamed protein product [Hermetia illucens]
MDPSLTSEQAKNNTNISKKFQVMVIPDMAIAMKFPVVNGRVEIHEFVNGCAELTIVAKDQARWKVEALPPNWSLVFQVIENVEQTIVDCVIQQSARNIPQAPRIYNDKKLSVAEKQDTIGHTHRNVKMNICNNNN